VIARGQRAEAVQLENLHDQLADSRFLLHHEDGGSRGGAGARQRHRERRAAAGCARDLHVAAVARDDVVDGRESEPRALAGRLRREVRVEGALARRLVHADARVLDAQQRGRLGAGAVGVGRQRRAHGHAPAERHGVARVQDQVHRDLLERGGAEGDRAHLGLELGSHLDVLSEQRLQRADEAEDHGVEIGHGGLGRLRPPRGQELAREPLAPARRLADRLRAPPRRAVGGHALEQQLVLAGDGRHHVAEVVRDADGHAAERPERPRLRQLAFERGDARARVVEIAPERPDVIRGGRHVPRPAARPA